MIKWANWTSIGCKRGYALGLRQGGLKSSHRTISLLSPKRFEEIVEKSDTKHQVYISRSNDPYLNLSIEHYLLENTSAESRILFLYKNAPTVVIGRNQNPWLETNLRFLRHPHGKYIEHELSRLGKINLVRRRSGGGAVFHDEGNLNYSAICPSAEFDRNKYAEMVAKALRELGAARVHVNGRHDIVLDRTSISEEDNNNPGSGKQDEEKRLPLKISGSAYKIIQRPSHRSLHHGTCLLASPNLDILHDLLHSPARGYIEARGVESVKSPVGNVAMALGSNKVSSLVEDAAHQIITEFTKMHDCGINRETLELFWSPTSQETVLTGFSCAVAFIGEPHKELPKIHNGFTELTSVEWIYDQTPQFRLSNQLSTEINQTENPQLLPSAVVDITAKGGAIISSRISVSKDDEAAQREAERYGKILENKKIRDISDWVELFREDGHGRLGEGWLAISNWLNKMLGVDAK
ncbi:MAG: Biotin/lipoate A/B protein ligase [Cirrosporium novae-zelandiae]|nr:MAG: Biotin/lipoate A/B protein ligase [Cirrosporium novae-zelandiae]